MRLQICAEFVPAGILGYNKKKIKLQISLMLPVSTYKIVGKDPKLKKKV